MLRKLLTILLGGSLLVSLHAADADVPEYWQCRFIVGGVYASSFSFYQGDAIRYYIPSGSQTSDPGYGGVHFGYQGVHLVFKANDTRGRVGVTATGGNTYYYNYKAANPSLPTPSSTVSGSRTYTALTIDYENNGGIQNIFEEGRSLVFKTQGTRSVVNGWYSHLEINIYTGSTPPSTNWRTISASVSGGTCRIYSSSIRSIDPNYVGKKIAVRVRWRHSSSATSTSLGASTPRYVKFLPSLDISSNITDPTCAGRAGTASFTINNFETTTSPGGDAITYLYTYSLYSRKNNVSTGTIPAGSGLQSQYTIGGDTYYYTGDGLTQRQTVNHSGDKFTLSFNHAYDGMYYIVLYIRAGNVDYFTYSEYFLVKEPDEIDPVVTKFPYCERNGIEYLLKGYSGYAIRINAQANYGNGNPMPLLGKRIITDEIDGPPTPIPVNGTAFAYSNSFPFGNNLRVRVYNQNDETCYTDIPEIELLNAPMFNVSAPRYIDPVCPSNSESGVTTGAVEFTLSDGCSSNYSYRFSNTSFVPIGNSNGLLLLENQAIGDHTVYITDDVNTRTVNYTIVAPDSLKYYYKIEDAICAGDQATITIDSVTGFGVAPTISFPGTTNASVAVTPREFNIPSEALTNFTIDDGVCSISFSETAGQAPDPISTSITDRNPTSCNSGLNSENGSVEIEIEGGTITHGTYSVQFGASAPYEDVARIVKHNLSADTYRIRINDDNGCPFYETTVEIEGNSDHLGISSTSSTNQVCTTVENGTITATVDPSSYSASNFNWLLRDDDGSVIPGKTAQGSIITINELAEGDYTIEVTDDSSCVASQAVSVTMNSPQFDFNGLPVTSNTMCSGVNTGSMTISVGNASPGTNTFSITGPESYSDVQTTSNTSAEFTVLGAGEYQIEVEDDIGCIITSSAIIGENANPVEFTTVDITPKYCDEVDGGSVRIVTQHNQGEAVDNISLYNQLDYLINSVDNNVTDFFELGTNSEETNYTIRATGTNGCFRDQEISIPNLKNNPVVDITVTNLLACEGRENGAVEIVVEQNDGPYEYTMNGETQTGNTASFSGLSGVTYDVEVTDQFGCIGNADVTIPVIAQPFEVSLNEITPSSCEEADNGQIHLSGRGGIPADQDYTFTLIDESTDIVIATLTGREVIFEDLAANLQFSYQASDNEGCEDGSEYNDIIPVLTDEALDLVLLDEIDATCPEAATGSMDLQTRFGNHFDDGFHYSVYSLETDELINQFSANALPTADNLTPGNYRIVVDDEDGCMAEVTAEIGAPEAVTLTPTAGIVARKGESTGQAVAEAALGNDSYIIEWYRGDAVDAVNLIARDETSSSSSISNVPAGDYLVRVSDIEGCEFWDGDTWLEEIISIEEPEEALSITIEEITDAACNGDENGAIEVNITGGWDEEYNVGTSLTNLTQTDIIEGLGAANYTIYVEDAEGVVESVDATVSEPDPLESVIDDFTNLECFEGDDGTITLTISGGTEPYIIPDNTVNWLDNNNVIVEGLMFGEHTINILDAHECATNSTQALSQPDKGMEIVEENITDTECGVAEGIIQITAEGGTPGYTYHWENEEGDAIEGDEQIENLLSGYYDLVLTDNNGCDQRFTFLVEDITTLSIENWVIKAVDCWGDANGEAEMDVVEGFPPYEISWPDGSHGESERVENLAAGTYTVNILDSEGCRKDTTFTIPTPEDLSIGSLTREDPLCFGVDDGSLEVEGAGGTPGFTYEWSNDKSGNKIDKLEAGTYNLTVTDAHGCSKTYTYEMKHQTEVETELMESVTICYGNEFPLDPGDFISYQWSYELDDLELDPEVEDEIDIDEISEEELTEQILYAAEPGVYTVEVEDYAGCLGTGFTEIEISETQFEAQAIMASEIYLDDTVAIFETSRTVPDSMEIFFSDGLEVIEQGPHYCYVKPSAVGTYTITVIAYRNDCMDIQVKEVEVIPGSASDGVAKFASNSFIKSFNLFPNPNDGNFSVNIELASEADATLRLLSHKGTGVLNQKKLYKNSEYEVQYNLSGIMPDVYVLFLEAGGETRSIKFIIL